MLDCVTICILEPEDIAEGLNDEWGLTDSKDPRWIDSCDILEAISDYQNFGCNCYISVSFDKTSIDWAKRDVEYHNDRGLDTSVVCLRLRVLNWLRGQIPSCYTNCLLKIDY